MIMLYLMMLCIAAKSNKNGALMLSDDLAYDDNIIASLTQMDVKLVQSALQALMKFGFITQKDGTYCIQGYNNLAVIPTET